MQPRLVTVLAVVHAVVVAAVGCQPHAAPAGSEAATSPGGPPPPPASVTSGSGNSQPQAELLAAYRTAHERGDVAAVLKLYCFDGASSDVREVTRENVAHQLRYPLADLSIAPLPPDHVHVRHEGDVRLRSNLPDVALATAKFDTSRAAPGEWAVSEAVLAVGMKGGRCYFTVPVREN